MAELKESGEHESSLLDAGRTGKSGDLAIGSSGNLKPNSAAIQNHRMTRSSDDPIKFQADPLDRVTGRE